MIEQEDEWEEQDEFWGELSEEEGEYIPPGYQAAEGPYKMYCSCENFVTCNFCKCFNRIKECRIHKNATKPPFRPCTCPRLQLHRSDGDEPKESSMALVQSGKSQAILNRSDASRLVGSCECTETPPAPQKCECDCLFPVGGTTKPSKSLEGIRPKRSEEVFDPNHSEEGEYLLGEEEQMPEEYGHESEGADYELEKSVETFVKKVEPVSTSDHQWIQREAKPCTCKISQAPRSGSSSETLETDLEKSWSSSSFDKIDPGEGLGDDIGSSDLTESEDSSTDSTQIFDPTRVNWISNTSDRSVESLSEADLDEDEIDKIAADWGIRNIYGKNGVSTCRQKDLREIARRTTDATVKESENAVYQYLVVQQNHREKYAKKICKSDKGKTKPYSYKFLEL